MATSTIPSGDFSIPLTRAEDAPMSARAALFDTFDTFANPLISYTQVAFFESANPGAVTALYAWAAARDINVEVRNVLDSDQCVHGVRLENGPQIDVYAHRGVQP